MLQTPISRPQSPFPFALSLPSTATATQVQVQGQGQNQVGFQNSNTTSEFIQLHEQPRRINSNMMAIHEPRSHPHFHPHSHIIPPHGNNHTTTQSPHHHLNHSHSFQTYIPNRPQINHCSTGPSSSSSSSSSIPNPNPNPNSTPNLNPNRPIFTHSQSLFSQTTTPSSSSSSPISSSFKRPKPTKKPTSSTGTKRSTVQSSLEAKVEKAKGFHAFFVPLARSLPPAPPSSPVLAPSSNPPPPPPSYSGIGIGIGIGNSSTNNVKGKGKGKEVTHVRDYFGQWDDKRDRKGEEWVEDINDIEPMDLDD